jgi:hypothetical protein
LRRDGKRDCVGVGARLRPAPFGVRQLAAAFTTGGLPPFFLAPMVLRGNACRGRHARVAGVTAAVCMGASRPHRELAVRHVCFTAVGVETFGRNSGSVGRPATTGGLGRNSGSVGRPATTGGLGRNSGSVGRPATTGDQNNAQTGMSVPLCVEDSPGERGRGRQQAAGRESSSKLLHSRTDGVAVLRPCRWSGWG